MTPCQLQNRGRSANEAAICIKSMKLVVPNRNGLWLGGRGSRREVIPALKRSSREDELVGGTVETKMTSFFYECRSFWMSSEADGIVGELKSKPKNLKEL